MGYCHVAQPVYLATGELEDALVGNLFFFYTFPEIIWQLLHAVKLTSGLWICILYML
jgi:hypothetical protein